MTPYAYTYGCCVYCSVSFYDHPISHRNGELCWSCGVEDCGCIVCWASSIGDRTAIGYGHDDDDEGHPRAPLEEDEDDDAKGFA